MTSEPEWATPRPEQIPLYCLTCRRALFTGLSRAGVFDFTLAGNVNKVKVTRVPTSTSTLNPAPTFLPGTGY